MNHDKLVIFRGFDPGAVTTLLCDADGNLFPSEEPAFAASVEVTNQYLAKYGVKTRYTAEELCIQTTGKNFRTTAVDLAVQGGVPIEEAIAQGHQDAVIATHGDVVADRALRRGELDDWVRRERDHVTAHLGAVLQPDPSVKEPLRALSCRYGLAAVSSSASVRLDACFAATGLDSLIPAALRFSAEDSLPVPTSKPSPAVYLLAGQVLGLDATQGLAIEDSVPGVLSAVAAGFPTIGNLMFVPAAERRRRAIELVHAGASGITTSWRAVSDYLLTPRGPSRTLEYTAAARGRITQPCAGDP